MEAKNRSLQAEQAGVIKNWPYFVEQNMSPYGEWFCCSTDDLRFVPLKGACRLHRNTEFDAYVANCGCREWKFAKRSAKEIEQIRVLREAVRRESILRQAEEIKASLK